MKSLINHSLKLILLIFVLSAVAANAQDDARIRFDKLNGLETKARDVVEVNIDGKMLDLAKRVMAKSKEPDAQKVGQAIKDLKGIYVRVYNFENENEYNMADIDEIRAQFQAPGWERLANVRSKRNNQKVDVYTMFTGEMMSGVGIVVTESKSIAFINIIGPIDIDLLMELSGRMNIPRIEIEKEGEKSEKSEKTKN